MAGQVGPGEGARDELGDALAVGPPAGPWAQPAHDLAQVTGVPGTGGGDRLVHERADRGLVELLGQVAAEDGDLGLLLRGEVLAAALPEGVDGLAAGLDLAGQDGEQLVVGERRLPGLRLDKRPLPECLLPYREEPV